MSEFERLVAVIDKMMSQRPPSEQDVDGDTAEGDWDVLRQWASGPFAPKQKLMAVQLNALGRTVAYFVGQIGNRRADLSEAIQNLQDEVSRLTSLLKERYEQVEERTRQLEQELYNRDSVCDSESRLRGTRSSAGEMLYRVIAALPWALSGVAAISLMASYIDPNWKVWVIWSWGTAATIAMCTLAVGSCWLFLPLTNRRSRWKLMKSKRGLFLKLRSGRKHIIPLTEAEWWWSTSLLGRLFGISWVKCSDGWACAPLLTDSLQMRNSFGSKLVGSTVRSAREIGALVAVVLTGTIAIARELKVHGQSVGDVDHRYLLLLLAGLLLCRVASWLIGAIWEKSLEASRPQGGLSRSRFIRPALSVWTGATLMLILEPFLPPAALIGVFGVATLAALMASYHEYTGFKLPP
jgi:hypothetical protein